MSRALGLLKASAHGGRAVSHLPVTNINSILAILQVWYVVWHYLTSLTFSLLLQTYPIDPMYVLLKKVTAIF